MPYHPVIREYGLWRQGIVVSVNVHDQGCRSKTLRNPCNVCKRLIDIYSPSRHCLTALSDDHQNARLSSLTKGV